MRRGDRGREDSDKDVTRPTHIVRNTIDSDEDEVGRPDFLVCIDGEAPQNDENQCKFSAFLFLQHCCIRLVCVLVVFECASLCSNFLWSISPHFSLS